MVEYQKCECQPPVRSKDRVMRAAPWRRGPGGNWWRSAASRRRSATSGGALVVVLAASVAGCGGSGTLSHAQLVERGDAICKTANQQLGAVPSVTNRSQLLAVIDKTYASGRDQISKLQKLNVGGADRPAFAAFLHAFDATVTDFHDMGTALASNNLSALTAAHSRQLRDMPGIAPAAQRVGFKVCGAP